MSSAMKKKERLDRKIRRLYRRLGQPRYWHHMGPKRFETWVHCMGLIVRQVFRLSYRRTAKFLDEYFDIRMHFTTLQKAADRLPKRFWKGLFATTIPPDPVYLAAADGTGLSRSGPSQYYLRQIHRQNPVSRPMQLILVIDIARRTILAR